MISRAAAVPATLATLLLLAAPAGFALACAAATPSSAG